jgi:hypothetical protein
MILDDFVMLGSTVPDPRRGKNADDRVFVCSAGFSAELKQLVRIYPLAVKSVPKRWHIYRIQLERNNQDSRIESWKIAGDRSSEAHPRINERFELLGKVQESEKMEMLRPFIVDSISEANNRRLSLAVIEPKFPMQISFDENQFSPNSPQLRLFDLNEPIGKGSKRFAFVPKIKFTDGDGEHNLLLRDWGSFEFMRKHGDYRRMDLAAALRLEEQPLLLIGNMANFRNTWLIISVFSPRISQQQE